MLTKTKSAPVVDLIAAKAKQQATWASADYGVVGTTLQIVGETLCEAADLTPGAKVLDVAAGNGNATLAAARRFCDVTSTDYVDDLLEQGKRRADAEGHTIAFQIADAESLPFDDESFDVVLSTFGVMFTPDQERAAAEMARVCRPGGTIAMANWTPNGFVGQMFKTLGQFIPPAPGIRSPARWGTPEAIEEMFGPLVSRIDVRPRRFVFRYRSFDHFLGVFRTYYGPIHKAMIALGDEAPAFEDALRDLHARFNIAGPEGFIVPGDYAEICITK